MPNSMKSMRSPPPLDLHAAAPPWDYNPSAWRQRVPVAVLGGLGAVIAAYMALYQWRLIDGVWDPIFGEGSEKVLDSHVSEAMRRWILIPDAALGAVAYFSEVIYSLAGSTRRWQCRPWMTLLFGFDVIPLGIVSAVLVVLQGAAVGHWCTLCLVTAAISLVLIFFAYDEVWSCLVYLHRVWKKHRSAAVLWNVLWGRPVPEAREAAP